MTNTLGIIRSLLIYGLCLPFAVYLGYLLAQPFDRGSLTFLIAAMALPLVPILLHWHHVLLILSWNLSMVLFFLPGAPHLWILMSALSLGLTVLQYVLKRNVKFIHVPSVTWSLIFLAFVILMTAKLTGGIGIRALGGENMIGGKRYILLLGAIIGYFALTSHRIPPQRVKLYVSLYFLAGLTSLISSLGPWVPGNLRMIFILFPVESLATRAEAEAQEMSRLGGLALAGLSTLYFILVHHNLSGLFKLSERWRFLPFQFKGGPSINQPWRLLLLPVILLAVLMGGYRVNLVTVLLVCVILFYLEGMFRSRLLPVLALSGILLAAVALPFIDKMPLTLQRSLSFLPLNISSEARLSADSTVEWRLNIWRELLPTIPQYLLIGKGYSIDAKEMEAESAVSKYHKDTWEEGSKMVGDFHNGPLSVIIPLGIFGAIGFLWFLIAGFRVLLNNYRYGEATNHKINTFLLAYFCTRVIIFFVIFGSLYVELTVFVGLVGLGLAVNGVVKRPAPAPKAPNPAYLPFRLPKAARS
jgi:O-antigen ligase